ncbi:MAG: ABC transporter substrate-binding protein [Deltaproteobacteria bacterium]|nr:ABC transporter substrate-binding protein [Deltaproteobacteria bacterium]
MVVFGQGCTSSDDDSVDASLPEFKGEPLKVGALLCVSSAFAARAPNLERAALLAEDYINGSTRAFPDVPADQIPCRVIKNAGEQHACGVWVGADADGAEIRGPLKIVVADSEDRVDRGVAAARALVEQHGVNTIVGPCNAEVMQAVFDEVTGTQTVLVSPTVTADSISMLGDRTADDIAGGLSGYVNRTITPDYIQARMMALVAGNRVKPEPMIRWDDQLPDDCTEQPSSYCRATYNDLGISGGCMPSAHNALPDKIFFRYSETDCANQADGVKFCEEKEGKNYECQTNPDNGKQVCAQWKERKWCTKVVKPQTAMLLYQDRPFGQGLRNVLVNAWETLYGMHVLSSFAYDPNEPKTFGNAITELFTNGSTRFDELSAAGSITDTTLRFADSVVFLLAEATDGALLLQEWSIRAPTLPEGTRDVFWVAPDPVRNSLLVNQVSFDTVKNLFVTDPGTLDINKTAFFDGLWNKRWNVAAGDFVGNVFDAVILSALAQERGGYWRMAASPTTALGPNDSASVKEAMRDVSAGCRKVQMSDTCVDTVTPFGPDLYADAVRAVRSGQAVRQGGVTGDLSLSPAGDRLADFAVWRVIRSEDTPDRAVFFRHGSLVPGAQGIGLDY